MPSFNLLEEPWIPCVISGSHRELGLQAILARAPDLEGVSDPSPIVTVGLHRLLLAILHRNFGPQSTAEWRAIWDAGKWDGETLATYFKEWGDRFDLFDGENPFYQTASLDFCYEVPVSKLTHELASGNNPTLFDHSADGVPRELTPAHAARYLVGYQAFAVGGLVTRLPGQGPSADAAPLTKGAVALVRGRNLFQTLMLNLHCYSREDEEPFRSQADDAPAWERDEGTRAIDRYPNGYLDLLTWQSRRIRLHPEDDPDGRTVVRQVVIMKGDQFPDGFDSHSRETMVAYRRLEKPLKGQDPWPPVGLREERALWRDSLSLFQSVEDKHARPKVLNWLNDLALEGVIRRSDTLQLDMLGLSTDRAKVLFWRHERLPLPLAYLEDSDLLAKLRDALELGEKVGRLLRAGFDEARRDGEVKHIPRPLQVLAVALLSSLEGRKPDQDAVGKLVSSLAPERAYWPRLETPFKRLLLDLAQDGEQGEKTLAEWANTLRTVGWQAFRETTGSLDTSARTLKARAQAERAFSAGLKRVLGHYLKIEEGGEA